MARPRQPLALIEAKGKKHLTKAEKEERRATEVQPCTDDLTAPSYLTATQRRQFDKLAGQLVKIKIMGETDVDALARYVTAQHLYEQAVKELRRLAKDRPKDPEAASYMVDLERWSILNDLADKRQDRYFKQAASAASALGLTITSRCKLVAPSPPEAPPENKFAKFRKAAGDE